MCFRVTTITVTLTGKLSYFEGIVDRDVYCIFTKSNSIEGNTCKEAEEKGAYILHGNRMMFHRSIINFDPAFHTIYETIQKVRIFSVGNE